MINYYLEITSGINVGQNPFPRQYLWEIKSPNKRCFVWAGRKGSLVLFYIPDFYCTSTSKKRITPAKIKLFPNKQRTIFFQYPSIFSFHLNPPPNRVLFLEEGKGYLAVCFFFLKRLIRVVNSRCFMVNFLISTNRLHSRNFHLLSFR
jgi:hypothetical protein